MPDDEVIEAIDATEVAALEQAADGMPSHAEAAAADAERKRAQDAREPHRYLAAEGSEPYSLCVTCGLAFAAKVHVQGEAMPDRRIPEVQPQAMPPDLPAKPEPKGALESLVETLVEQAVGARLDALARELQATRRYALHTMHLVVVLADRFNVTQEQLAGAYAATQQAEAARKEQA